MKKLLMIFVVAVLGSACAVQRPPTVVAAPSKSVEGSAVGAPVTLVNTQFGFVVLDYSSRAMPAVGTRLSVYRDQQRVGAVKITEPVRPRFATADVLEGTLQPGDEAR